VLVVMDLGETWKKRQKENGREGHKPEKGERAATHQNRHSRVLCADESLAHHLQCVAPVCDLRGKASSKSSFFSHSLPDWLSVGNEQEEKEL
jgi:hypothetical protein